MSSLRLSREILENITNGNQQAIKALETIFSDVTVYLPEQLETAINQASAAVAASNQALGLLFEISLMLEQLVHAPAAIPPTEFEDHRPAVQVGSIAIQEADNVEVTGGTVGLSAGAVATPSLYLVDRTTGIYRAAANEWRMSVSGVDMITYKATGLTITQQITSTVVAGTPPLVVASNTKVVNLNVDKLDDKDWTEPGPIGGTTPDSASFTTMLASGGIGCNGKPVAAVQVSGGTLVGVIAGLVNIGLFSS